MYVEADKTLLNINRLYFPPVSEWSESPCHDVSHYDETAGLTYCPDVTSDEHIKVQSLKTSTIVVAVDGSTQRENGVSQRASYAVYFGPSSPWNECGIVPGDESDSAIAAKAYAAKRAIEIIEDDISREHKISCLLLKTCSAYLTRCMAESIYQCEANNWTGADDEAHSSRFMLLSLHDAIDEASKEERFITKFWHDGEIANSEVAGLARSALEPDNLAASLAPRLRNMNVLGSSQNANSDNILNQSTQFEHAGTSREDPWEESLSYWSHTAPADPLAIELCRRLRIPLHIIEPGMFTGFESPIRRLVTTGHDLPRNFKLLFGTHWRDAVEEEWIGIRTQCLGPAPRAETYACRSGRMLDAGAPFRRLRPASKEERKRIRLLTVLRKSIKKTIKEKGDV